MQIAIISDIHDNITNLTKVLDYCREHKIEKTICCGDLASLETLDFLNDNFQKEIFFVFGNMDDDYLRNYPFENNIYKHTKIFKDFGEAEIEKQKIAFVHKPEPAKNLCETGKYDFVFHGHTHKPWTEKINNRTILNPGNVANQIYPPTFAVWHTENNKFDLIKINELV
ncbi:MAG TPA: YfcE family phosphodiesterase [Candidatus Moranbacteria bacterium]|nr:YfcE family phosphodiesterase [Candidatus Moranbacteria bacterium]HRZ33542.1 YfcE family phosphodiesterase [Candidatus Moranbacteria bacterium]